MQTYDYEALQIKGTTTQKVNESLVVEAALQININEEPYTVVMRTPGNDFELIRGLLYAEDIYKEAMFLEERLNFAYNWPEWDCPSSMIRFMGSLPSHLSNMVCMLLN